MKSPHSSSGRKKPVDSRAGSTLATSTTGRIPNPVMPVFDSPEQKAATANPIHCQ